jgi:hypothetical protein
MSARERPPEGRDPRSVSEAAERLAAIVEAAEEAASRVIDDAEAEARRRLDDAEDRAERLVAEKLRALADEIDPPRSSGGTVASLRPVGPVEGEARETLPPGEPREAAPIAPRRSGSAGARLLATQMAVSGASRGEIEKRLQNGFEIDDASEILDAILGPEG